MPNQDILNTLKLIWPLIVLQVGVAIWVIVDIVKKKRTRNLNPTLWIIISLFINIIGPIVYFLFGRAED